MPERDAHGRFVSSKIKSKTSVSTPADVPLNPEFEKPVLVVTITNPFKKILYWLDQIRKRQTTTFAVKLSIPLIALPVIIFAAFQVGRSSVVLPFLQSSPATSYQQPVTSPPPVPYSRSGTLKVAKTTNQIKYVLALKNGENVLLEIPQNIELTKYQNKQVLVTGYYMRQANSIKVLEIAEIELISETTITNPSPTPLPSPSQSTSSAQ